MSRLQTNIILVTECRRYFAQENFSCKLMSGDINVWLDPLPPCHSLSLFCLTPLPPRPVAYFLNGPLVLWEVVLRCILCYRNYEFHLLGKHVCLLWDQQLKSRKMIMVTFNVLKNLTMRSRAWKPFFYGLESIRYLGPIRFGC